MKPTLAALLLAAVTLLPTACSDDGPPDSTGDSVTENQQTQEPGSTPTK